MIYNNIDRIKYTLTKGNKANIKDFEALNGIIDYANKEKERLLTNNHLFAKLYISLFTRGIEKSNGNYQKIADELREPLKMPLETIYDNFHQQMNSTEFENIINILGMTDKHPALRTEEENENDKKIINENIGELTKALSHYNKEDVFNRLNNVMNNLIEDYDTRQKNSKEN